MRTPCARGAPMSSERDQACASNINSAERAETAAARQSGPRVAPSAAADARSLARAASWSGRPEPDRESAAIRRADAGAIPASRAGAIASSSPIRSCGPTPTPCRLCRHRRPRSHADPESFLGAKTEVDDTRGRIATRHRPKCSGHSRAPTATSDATTKLTGPRPDRGSTARQEPARLGRSQSLQRRLS